MGQIPSVARRRINDRYSPKLTIGRIRPMPVSPKPTLSRLFRLMAQISACYGVTDHAKQDFRMRMGLP